MKILRTIKEISRYQVYNIQNIRKKLGVYCLGCKLKEQVPEAKRVIVKWTKVRTPLKICYL